MSVFSFLLFSFLFFGQDQERKVKETKQIIKNILFSSFHIEFDRFSVTKKEKKKDKTMSSTSASSSSSSKPSFAKLRRNKVQEPAAATSQNWMVLCIELFCNFILKELENYFTLSMKQSFDQFVFVCLLVTHVHCAWFLCSLSLVALLCVLLIGIF